MAEVSQISTQSSPPKIQAKVIKVTQLTFEAGHSKYRINIELPGDATYEVGDCLDVYPSNVQQPIAELDDLFRIRNALSTTEGNVLVSEEAINEPVTSKQLEVLIDCFADHQDKSTFQAARENLCKAPGHLRPSISQLLDAYPSIKIQSDQLSAVLPPLRPRRYFISSSPLKSASRCSLTWSLKTNHFPGFNSQDRAMEIGMASHFLARLALGDTLTCAPRPRSILRPPADLSTPIIMICDGDAIAPFIGFVEHRAERIRRDPALWDEIAPALLFVGYDNPQQAIIPLELGSSGVVDVRYAFRDFGEGGDFVGTAEQIMWADREEVMKLWNRGASLFVCGTTQVIDIEVQQIMLRILQEAHIKRGGLQTETEVDERWERIFRETNRYNVEIF